MTTGDLKLSTVCFFLRDAYFMHRVPKTLTKLFYEIDLKLSFLCQNSSKASHFIRLSLHLMRRPNNGIFVFNVIVT